MPQLIKHGIPVTAEDYIILEDLSALPDATLPLLVTLEHLRQQPELLSRAGPLGVRLPADADVSTLQPFLVRLDMIALVFSSFSDGRGFSQASLLRQKYNYSGELRALGDIIPDIVYFLHQCGFDSYGLNDDQSIEDAVSALQSFTQPYQESRRHPPLFRRVQR
ncbi:MAG: DUF934 domain-containing protein [Pseudomonadales bacterium]|nr:DUF934 domain-containing protein [Pseudomonadales bacterium]